MDFNATIDIKPKLNGFDLSHNHYTTMDMGGLYPIAWLECVPGDIHRLDIQSLVRVQPMVSPILNNLTCDIHAFFVPTRLLWKDWESFITTIVQGKIPPETFKGSPPVWLQQDDNPDSITQLGAINTDSHSLWDMFGLSRIFKKDAIAENRPTDFLRRAYIDIWNNWFRDENLQEEIDYYNSDLQTVLPRAWRKDYFTAAYYTRQKGNSPSVPLNLEGSVTWDKTFNEALDKTLLNFARVGTEISHDIDVHIKGKVVGNDREGYFNNADNSFSSVITSLKNSTISFDVILLPSLQ